MSLFTLQTQKAIEPEELMPRPVTPTRTKNVSATAATAQTFDIDIPTDHFIHAILIAIGETSDTDPDVLGSLADDLTDITFILNGNNYVKDMTAGMCKAVSIMNKNVMTTGYYMLYFTDLKIKKAKPLPAWLFSSALLRLKDNAPAASQYHKIHVSVIETAGREITGEWPLLVEKYLPWRKYGTNTGIQEYAHERAYNIFGYLYAMDDTGTLSNTMFDKLTLIMRTKEAEKRLFNNYSIPMLREQDKVEYQSALPTGFFSIEFPAGLVSHKFTSAVSYLNIPTASATNAGLRVLERYCL